MTTSDQPIEFEAAIEALGGARVDVHEIELDERLFGPYQARVQIATDALDVDPVALRGTNLCLTLRRDDKQRRLVGVIREVEDGSGSEDRANLQLVVEPAFAHLSLGRNTRIFQEKDAPTILEEVLSEALGAYGREVTLGLDGAYATREYCVQYQESDLDFVHRLMEEEGIAYAFDHQGDVEVMHLTDTNQAFQRAPGAEQPLELQPHDLVITDAEPLHRFTRTHRTTTTSVVMRDFDWTLPTYAVDAEERSEDSKGRDRESYEHGWGRSATIYAYDAGARRYQEHDSDDRVRVRKERYLSTALLGRGLGRVIGFTPGTTFELIGHPQVGIDGEYLLTRVVHVTRATEGSTERYHNRFECIPLEVPFRPARTTPKPRIPSVQTARVTGPAGEEIHTDEHGRIKVRFPWDRLSPDDETSSCWVRAQQKWAGSGWGFFWLPRIGMEVVVQFVDGDPDRPLVTGSVYNASNALPYPLPDAKTKSTIKSNSSPGGGGSNELRFEDEAGSEEIYTHAQKDYREVVENDHTTLVHANQTNEVDGDQTQTIHGNQTERVDGDQELSVGGDRSVHAESNYDETVDGTETRVVTGDVDETFAANETRTVAANLDETIGANENRTLGGSQTETVSGSVTRDVGGSSTVTTGGAQSQTVAGGIEINAPGGWNVTAVGGLTVTAPGGFKLDAPGGFNIAAPGGVTQVDAGWATLASLVHCEGGSIRAMTTFKNEWVGTHISIVGRTYAVGGFHSLIGLVVDGEAAKDEAAGVDAGNNAVAAEAAGSTSTA